MALDIDWLEENAILTDSLLLLQALENDKLDAAEIRGTATTRHATLLTSFIYPARRISHETSLQIIMKRLLLSEPCLNKTFHFTTAQVFIKT